MGLTTQCEQTVHWECKKHDKTSPAVTDTRLQLDVCSGKILVFSLAATLCLCSAYVWHKNLLVKFRKTCRSGLKSRLWSDYLWGKKKKNQVLSPQKQLDMVQLPPNNNQLRSLAGSLPTDSICSRPFGNLGKCERQLKTIYCECDMPHLVQISTLGVSVTQRLWFVER